MTDQRMEQSDADREYDPDCPVCRGQQVLRDAGKAKQVSESEREAGRTVPISDTVRAPGMADAPATSPPSLTPLVVPEEAVEEVASIQYKRKGFNAPWKALDEYNRQPYLCRARDDLTAALPALLAANWPGEIRRRVENMADEICIALESKMYAMTRKYMEGKISDDDARRITRAALLALLGSEM